MDPVWSETCWSTFKYFIILIVSTNYILCISWIMKCLIRLVKVFCQISFIRFTTIRPLLGRFVRTCFAHEGLVPPCVYCTDIWPQESVQFAYFAQVSTPPPPQCLFIVHKVNWGTPLRTWLRHCATSLKVLGSILDDVIGIFHWHNPSSRTIALGWTRLLREMSTSNISWGGKDGRYVGLTTLPPSCADCNEIW
jgi:hypothetical protein